MDNFELSGKVIFDALNSGATLSSIVDPLVAPTSDNSEANSTRTLACILNLCFHVAGATIDVDEAAFTRDADIAAVLEEIIARVDESDCSSLLLTKDPKHKRLRRSFSGFFRSLVIASMSFEANELIGSVVTWLIHMNESKVRSFRHVALAAAGGIADGLHESLGLVGANSGHSKASLEEQIRTIFQLTIHNRIKDVAPEIRIAALQRLRQWILGYPDRYCLNSCLIYLRFALYDKRPEMRLEALECIGAILCEVPSGLSKLSALLKKCVERLVEMCKDVETRCAHSAIKLCTVLIRNNFTFEHTLLDEIFECLLDDRSIIRTAAGSFLKHFMAVTKKNTGTSPFAFIVALLQTLKYQCPTLVEEYLVDALWSNEDPPFSESVSDFSHMMKSSSEEDVLKGLRCVAALVKRAAGGEASLGPPTKDDLYIVSRGKKKNEQAKETLRAEYSKMGCDATFSILARHGSKKEILVAVGSLLEHINFDSCSSASLKKVFKAFRSSCLDCDIDVGEVSGIAAVWRKMAFGQHIESGTGEFELKEFSREVSKRLESRHKSSDSDWVRMIIITSVTNVVTAWDHFLSSLLSAMDSKQATRARIIAYSCFNTVMWSLASDARDGTSNTTEKVCTLAPVMLNFAVGLRVETESLPVAVDLLSFVCDLYALPALTIPGDQVESIVSTATFCLDELAAKSRQRSLEIKEMSRKLSSGEGWEDFVSARSESAVLEKDCARLAASTARLFYLQKIDASQSKMLFIPWPVVPKNTADLIKQLFHSLRDRCASNSFEFEKSILESAIANANPSEVASLTRIGMLGAKLASIHFAPTDKHYSSCVRIVEHALSVCTEEPLWLHATVMYCSKLRQQDALVSFGQAQLVQSRLEDNPYFATYLYTIAKAAKVTDVKLPRGKRGREQTSAEVTVDQELSDMLGNAEDAMPSASSGRRRTTSSGWRVNRSEADTLAEATLVATQEWE